MLIVDTSVWIDFLNGYRSFESEYLAACLADDVPVVLPGLVLAEILAGLKTEAEAVRVAAATGLRLVESAGQALC